MTAKTDIEKLFAMVAGDALKKGVSFDSRVEALKILKPYYEILVKKAGRLPSPPEAEGGPHFGDFQADMEDTPNGGSKVRDSHRRN